MDKVREYHDKFYRPDNIVIFVSGIIDKDILFGSFQAMEQEEQSKRRRALRKPIFKPCMPLEKEVSSEAWVRIPPLSPGIDLINFDQSIRLNEIK